MTYRSAHWSPGVVAATAETDYYGFRVASIPVPEPSTLALITLGFLSLLLKRR